MGREGSRKGEAILLILEPGQTNTSHYANGFTQLL